MIKILALNSKYVHTLLSPYYLKENCSYKDDIQIIQSNVNQDINLLYDIAVSYSPDAIAFPCYIFNIDCVLKLAQLIKARNPNIKIIFGGPEVSYEYEDILPKCDFLITGEGEIAFNDLICDLVNSNFKISNKKVYVGLPISFSKLKSPYSEDYFCDVAGKIAYFEASRGCPYSCAYCMSGNDGLRCFDLDRVFSELDKFKGKDIRVLKFVDRTFNAKKAFAKEILKYIISNKDCYSFSFHFEIAADILDDEFIDIVKKSPKGLFQFEVGVQSFNEKTLKEVVRKTNIDKVTDNLTKLISTGKSHIHTDLIAGLPYEDYNSFVDGFNRLYNLKSQMLQLGFLKVLKGSKLKSILDGGYKYRDTPPYEIISTPFIDEDELLKLKYAEEGCDKYYNSGIFTKTLEYFVKNNPFEFYLKIGSLIYGKNLSLFERVQILYNFLSKDNNEHLVKGIMTIDYLEHNNSRVLPPCLKFDYDKNFAKLLKELNIDKKKYFAVKIKINPTDYKFEDYLLYVDYSKGYDIKFISLNNRSVNEN